MIGDTFGHYRVLSRLGAGGMGEVYLAEDERLGRKVALKFLAPDLARSEEAVERFRNEARVAAGLSHANIAAIHGFDHDEERWFHIQEYVEGETLEHRLATGPLSIEDTRHLLVDLARGLGHAHTRGVIHRDIKPANVMITPEGTAKILDFGLARRSGTEGQTMPGVAVGTVAYMSPEQIQGETVDGRSDLWALGVLVYQSLTGSLPFAAEEMAAAMNKILHEDPRPLRELRPEVPEDIATCVDRCLRKAREERFARADDLLAALGLSSDSRMSHGAPTMPVQTGQAEQATQKPRTGLLVAGGIVVVLAIVMGIWLGTRDRGTGGPESLAGTGDDGAVSETVMVEDEFGQVTEQQVVDAKFRQKLSIFFTEVNPLLTEDDWLSEGLSVLINLDLTQNPFVAAATPFQFINSLRREGSEDGRNLSQTLARKIARERMSPWFVTSELDRNEAGEYRLELTVHETESGRAKRMQVIERADLFELADAASIAIRQDLQVPEVLAGKYRDLPVKELMTDSVEAYRSFILANKHLAFENDYAAAAQLLDVAVDVDSTFALAHFVNWGARNSLQDASGMERSGEMMMRYSYRLPDRLQYALKANYYLNIKKDPEKAFAVTKMWTQLHPDDENAFRQLAAFHELRNERQDQIMALEEILRIDPSDYRVVHRIAQVHQNLGEFDESARWMQKYVEAFPDRAESYEELGELYFDMGDRVAAMEEFEHALLIDERRIDTLLGVGRIHLREGRFAEAKLSIDDALHAASSGRDRATVHQQRRNLLHTQGRIEEAMQEEQANLEALAEVIPPPQLVLTRLTSLDLYMSKGQAEEALIIAQQASQQLNEQLEPAKALGTVPLYVALKQPAEAKTDLVLLEGFVNTYRVEQIRPVLDTMMADILDLEGDHAGAVALLKAAVANQPSNPELKRKLARSLRKAGRSDEAEAQLEASLNLYPANPLTHVEYARLKQDQGKTTEAREHLEQALKAWENADADFVEKIKALELQASLQN